MADHLREQIHAAFTTLVTGLATTAGRVFKGRYYPLDKIELPCICTHWTVEEADVSRQGPSPRSVLRRLELLAEVYVTATTGVETTMNLAAKEIETAVAADRKLGGLARDTFLLSSEHADIEIAEKPHGMLRLTFAVFYQTTDSDPAVAT